MPRPIQRFPQALFEFLRLTSVPAPNQLQDEVVGTVDLTPHYEQDLLLSAAAPAPSVSALPMFQTLVIGRQRLKSVGFVYTQGAAAGTNLVFSVGLATPGVSTRAPLGAFALPAVAAGQIVEWGVQTDLMTPAGTTLHVRVTGTAAGADHSVQLIELLLNYFS